MPRYVAFLRAVNVGGRTVKMDALRRAFEAMGFAGAETFIASGNVIFDSPSRGARALEATIEAGLREAFRFEVPAMVRSAAEVKRIAAFEPFPPSELEAEGNGLAIGFLSDEPAPEAVEKLLSLAGQANGFRVEGRELYWLLRTRFSDSEFSGARLEKTLGVAATVRNSTTVRKIAAKYA